MLDIDEGQWDRVVDLNLKWTFFAMQAAARAMAARGGSIVNLSSRSGSQPCPPTAHYGSAKAGVDSLTATRSEERREGKECVSTCRSRWAPDKEKKNERYTNKSM